MRRPRSRPITYSASCRASVAALLALACAGRSVAEDYSAPPLMLANAYVAGTRVLADYWASEKYDGVRAYWDGRALLTRSGLVIHAPAWFVAPLPREPLDGELWIGRGEFQAVVATVRDRVPDDAAWRRVRYLVFDLPTHGGTFSDRRSGVLRLLATVQAEWIRPVEHFVVRSDAELAQRLQAVVAAGGEGLMLHKAQAHYRAVRSDDLLKVKLRADGDARVVGYIPGKGKYAGLTGALEVETAAGIRFKVGSGLSDAERGDPPALGSWILYSHEGYTKAGIPRFARYIRTRDDVEGFVKP